MTPNRNRQRESSGLRVTFIFHLGLVLVNGRHLTTFNNDTGGEIVGVAYDWITNKVYWIDRERKRISVVDLPCCTFTTLYEFEDMTRSTWSIELDPYHG